MLLYMNNTKKQNEIYPCFLMKNATLICQDAGNDRYRANQQDAHTKYKDHFLHLFIPFGRCIDLVIKACTNDGDDH